MVLVKDTRDEAILSCQRKSIISILLYRSGEENLVGRKVGNNVT